MHRSIKIAKNIWGEGILLQETSHYHQWQRDPLFIPIHTDFILHFTLCLCENRQVTSAYKSALSMAVWVFFQCERAEILKRRKILSC